MDTITKAKLICRLQTGSDICIHMKHFPEVFSVMNILLSQASLVLEKTFCSGNFTDFAKILAIALNLSP